MGQRVLFGLCLCVVLIIPTVYCAAQPDPPIDFGPNEKPWPSLFAFDLTSDNLDHTLHQANAKYIMLEFFANWCPVCKRFAPEYERLAHMYMFDGKAEISNEDRELLRNHIRSKQLDVFVARLDCATSEGWRACSIYKAQSWPKVYFGPKEYFVPGPKQKQPSDIDVIPEKTASRASLITKWINDKISNQIRRQYVLPEVSIYRSLLQKLQTELGWLKQVQFFDQSHVNLWDTETALALIFDYTFKGDPKAGKGLTPRKREWLSNFLDLLQKYYPVAECRISFEIFQKALPTLWPEYKTDSLDGKKEVARGKPAVQSSTGFKGEASRAVDGDTRTAFFDDSCTHTRFEPSPWWRVDLLKPYSIDSVSIHNRGDCCGERLNGYRVYIGNGNVDHNYLENNQECVNDKNEYPQIAQGASGLVPCHGKVGRYLWVIIPGNPSDNNVLSMCEVQVFIKQKNTTNQVGDKQGNEDIVPSTDKPADVTFIEPNQVRHHWSLCMRNDWKIYEKKGWEMCRGSFWFSRGYTCGLWLLFHTLTAHVEDKDAHQLVLAIQEFLDLYFDCRECRAHFLAMCHHDNLSHVKNRREAVMWFWRAHNRVNFRVGLIEQEEKMDVSGAHDSAFPKIQFPPASLCPDCRKDLSDSSNAWDEDRVYQFLLRFYSSKPNNEKSRENHQHTEL